MTLTALVREAQVRLAAAGLPAPEAALDADLLARLVLQWDRATWVMRSSEEAPPAFGTTFERLVERRVNREPVAYIRGSQEFWGRDFAVTPSVLIPRPETELVIEEALEWAQRRSAAEPARIADIGTGSGCLAITLALELPQSRVVATDISPEALGVARENARRMGADIQFQHGSYGAGTNGPFDLIVSNPPYVAESDYRSLQPEVRTYEPSIALLGGREGLDVIAGLIEVAAANLVPAGRILIEIGAGQAAAVGAMVADAEGLQLLRVRPDLQGIARVVVVDRIAERATSWG